MAGQHSRPRWHYSPQHVWMNDPNRLVHNAGKCHMFNVDVLIDTCSSEVFAAGGLVAITDLVFF